MLRVFRLIARSLEVRLFLPLAVTIALVLSVHAYLGYRSARGEIARFVRDDLERSGVLIENATHDGMLLNRLDEVQARLERLGSVPEFTTIRIYGKDGRIALSADPGERGLALPIESEVCTACHQPGARDGEEVPEQSRSFGDGAGQRLLTVIRNEPACATAGCHAPPSMQPVLGVLDVRMSTVPFESAIGRARGRLVLTTVALLLGSGLVAAFCIRVLVHAPVTRLHEGTRRIAAGDLETRIEVPGRHELAQLAGAFNTMTDELRGARGELESWSRTLEARVEAQTDALLKAQQRMTQVETMASLGKLAATVAHELNNPISGILAYARLVRRELSEPTLDPVRCEELSGHLALIEKECVRCGEIVRNMLAFARGRGFRPAPMDLNEGVEHALMLVRHHLDRHRIALEFAPLAGDPVIVADADQIRQAVLALLMNAIEAMQGRDGGRLVVRLEGDPDAARLSVRDNGVGIPEDLVPRIFEPFVSTKLDASGVGLGLSVVYGVVDRHGGSIEVRSKPGEGAEFLLTLPRSMPDTPRDRAPDRTGAAG
jgi:two-component system NtrC family sensor kinase